MSEIKSRGIYHCAQKSLVDIIPLVIECKRHYKIKCFVYMYFKNNTYVGFDLHEDLCPVPISLRTQILRYPLTNVI